MTNQQVYNIEQYMLRHHNTVKFDMREGNGCIWVTWGRMEMYFYFNGDTIVDVIVD